MGADAEGIGKISAESFQKYVQGRFGKPSARIVLPPQTGVDAGVIKIDRDKVLVVAEDPIFPAPGLPLETFGWFTVHIGASDIAVMGVEPQFMTYSLLMPPGTGDSDLDTMVGSIHRAALELNISIAGGHTGYYPSVNTPVIGGVTVFSLAHREEVVLPSGARPGDAVVMTKGPAVEAAALLAIVYKESLSGSYPESLIRKALSLHRQISCVKDALIARHHGVTAMHDATEGGVLGGLYEMAHSSGMGVVIDQEKMVYPEEIRVVCEHLNLDPLEAISEGTLLATLPASGAEGLVSDLRAQGIAASVVGEMLADASRREIRLNSGQTRRLTAPERDPFWPAFFAGLG